MSHSYVYCGPLAVCGCWFLRATGTVADGLLDGLAGYYDLGSARGSGAWFRAGCAPEGVGGASEVPPKEWNSRVELGVSKK